MHFFLLFLSSGQLSISLRHFTWWVGSQFKKSVYGPSLKTKRKINGRWQRLWTLITFMQNCLEHYYGNHEWDDDHWLITAPSLMSHFLAIPFLGIVQGQARLLGWNHFFILYSNYAGFAEVFLITSFLSTMLGHKRRWCSIMMRKTWKRRMYKLLSLPFHSFNVS